MKNVKDYNDGVGASPTRVDSVYYLEVLDGTSILITVIFLS